MRNQDRLILAGCAGPLVHQYHLQYASRSRRGRHKELGIDRWLKDSAAFSDKTPENVEAQRFYRDLEPARAVSQRPNKKRRGKAVHAKIANRRKDFLEKLSTRIVHEYGSLHSAW